MAKRFTDTDKWKKEWYCNLKPVHKVVWSYLTDNCSHAGIWEVNWKLAEFFVGAKLNPTEMERVFEKQFVPLDGGRRWFLRDFIDFQYGQLSPNTNTHRGILPILQQYGLLDDKLRISLPAIGLGKSSRPPADSGIMWSTSRMMFGGESPQYWQRKASLLKTSNRVFSLMGIVG